MTRAERVLWSILSDRKCGGQKFRRQHPIEPYIVDFYCAEAKLVVEIDGDSHDGRQDYDRRREEYLQKLGLRVMRITNGDVLENLDGVAEAILREAGPCPLPRIGELTELVSHSISKSDAAIGDSTGIGLTDRCALSRFTAQTSGTSAPVAVTTG